MDTAAHAKKYTGYVRIPVTVIAESSAQAHSYIQMTLREHIARASADPGICQVTVAQNPKEITQQELEAYKDSRIMNRLDRATCTTESLPNTLAVDAVAVDELMASS